MAYRKAKVDVFYSSLPSARKLVEYEKNLSKNLQSLLDNLQSDDENWIETQEFLGGWTVVPKLLDMKKDECNQSDTSFVHSTPQSEWDQSLHHLNEESKKPTATFRIMSDCSINFHVLSALWIQRVGHLFDSKLSDAAYGNRLRRPEDKVGLNELSLGLFQPYLKPYRDWRDTGIEAMRSALEANKKLVVITADITSFYHELSADFSLNNAFISDVLDIKLSDEERKLHRIFIKGLLAWANETPLKKGLPVGLSASSVIANLALIELDQVIQKEIVPLHYGRYVDDIILVMENGPQFTSSDDVWKWLIERSQGKLEKFDDNGKKGVAFKSQYLQVNTETCKIRFANSKNKIFILEGDSGKALVASISRHIQDRASEWRAFPHLAQTAEGVSSDLLIATQKDGDAADSLRKTELLSMHRAEFAIRLRDLEAHARSLPPNEWQAQRKAFFKAFTQHVLVLPFFFSLATYVRRVIQVAVACEDFAEVREMIEALSRLYTNTVTYCEIEINGSDRTTDIKNAGVVDLWRQQLQTMIRESMESAIPETLSELGNKSFIQAFDSYVPEFGTSDFWPVRYKQLVDEHTQLFETDLAYKPFRFIGLPSEVSGFSMENRDRDYAAYETELGLVRNTVFEGIEILSEWLELKAIPMGMVFATRPYNLLELGILKPNIYMSELQEKYSKVVLALRGFKPSSHSPRFHEKNILEIPYDEQTPKVTIIVSSWKTKLESWEASIVGKTDLDVGRYNRLNKMLDNVEVHTAQQAYLIMPELSLPARWFIGAARSLQRRGISLIAGVEYLHKSQAVLHNQVWASFIHDGFGFPSLMVYRQDKQKPALHEEAELKDKGGCIIEPMIPWDKPPVIQHGDFIFAILICSELTNIAYRTHLRGNVDALFVPEWNQDTESFNALVESAALDIHAYIIQCNDRQYGDSRIRAPYKENWQRDILRVKGGVQDYCVVGEIDIHQLRTFQSHHRSPDKPFKPVPDGFDLDQNRWEIPTGDNHAE
jgi:hypothetical protein